MLPGRRAQPDPTARLLSSRPRVNLDTTVETAILEIELEDEGPPDGRPLLLLHGWPDAPRRDPLPLAGRRIQWDTWSPPGWFDEDEFEATARSFTNPDWVAITLNAYRSRFLADKARDPQYEGLARRLAEVQTAASATFPTARHPRRSRRQSTGTSKLCPSSGRRDVLVDAEEVLGVVLPLQRLQAVVLLRAVGLPHSVLALVHQEVDVHGREMWLERGPEVAHPLAFLVESLGRRRARADVVREARVPPVEGGLVL